MAKSLSQHPVLFPINTAAVRKARHTAVLVLGLALVTVPPQVGFGQSNQQQEQQQREQQQRDQQQREQQEREQQQRDQQQREQQEREQQQRDQQQREQQQRELQERIQQQQHSSSVSPAPSPNVNLEESSPTSHSPKTDVNRTTSDVQPRSAERKINSAPAANATSTKDHASSAVEPELHGRVCEGGPCKEPAPKPVQLKPVVPEPSGKVCKDGPCKPCPKGQSEGKDGSCASPPAVVKNGNATGSGSARTAAPHLCPAGQVWNGAQCQIIGTQQCLPSQIMVGTTCQADCSTATGGAQSIIMELRSARQHKDDICRQDPAGMECQQAEAHYSLEFTEYQTFLAGVPTECRTSLPDPIAI